MMAEEEATRLVLVFVIAVGLFWFVNRLEKHRINRIIEEVRREERDRLDKCE